MDLLLRCVSLGACLLALPAFAGAAPVPSPSTVGDAAHGRVLYQACMACHSLDEDDVGPRHRGVLGRRAGSVDGYAYSPALRSSGVVWDVSTLDRWLTNPQAFIPGVKMFFSVAKAQDRADIIAYLAQQR